jgi:aryl-alcohol dehydrogenase-like predicted oxidoreductase
VITGAATPKGTEEFARRSNAAAGHFRQAAGLSLSSIGLGTYLGNEDSATDHGYEESVAIALANGINVFDSAINYRGQRSERAIGRALARAFAGGAAQRDEIFVSTKGGYLPHDSEDPRDARAYILETFVESNLAPRSELARGGHCLRPEYLRDQIDRSRRNLGLETIDLYYLHNVETQLAAAGPQVFRQRMRAAIEVLEDAISEGKVASWGLATWDGLRAPAEHPEHLSISDLLGLAREIAGAGHHFRAVQLPVNLAMSEAIAYPSQESAAGRVPALEAARASGLAAFGSASILQGRLAVELPEEIESALSGASSGAQKALQFSRSSPGMTTSLVGASNPAHASEDFGLAKVAPADPEVVLGLFS